MNDELNRSPDELKTVPVKWFIELKKQSDEVRSLLDTHQFGFNRTIDRHMSKLFTLIGYINSVEHIINNNYYDDAGNS